MVISLCKRIPLTRKTGNLGSRRIINGKSSGSYQTCLDRDATDKFREQSIWTQKWIMQADLVKDCNPSATVISMREKDSKAGTQAGAARPETCDRKRDGSWIEPESRKMPRLEEDISKNDGEERNINQHMRRCVSISARKIILAHYARHMVKGRAGIWQPLGKGNSLGSWIVAPDQAVDSQKLEREGRIEVAQESLDFPPKTILAKVDWNLPAAKDGKLLPASIQHFDYDGRCDCKVTVGKVPHSFQLLTYIGSTQREHSAIHANGGGDMSILEDFTVINFYWQGLAKSEGQWQVGPPRIVA